MKTQETQKLTIDSTDTYTGLDIQVGKKVRLNKSSVVRTGIITSKPFIGEVEKVLITTFSVKFLRATDDGEIEIKKTFKLLNGREYGTGKNKVTSFATEYQVLGLL